MSGISTIAIKDGHEGSRPSNDGGVSGADRIQRLGLGMAYFDQGSAAPAPRSPASSTATTSSTLEATKEAKMIDGMTYDEDVVDTTDKCPSATVVPKEKDVVAVPRRRKQDEADETEAETKAKV